MYFSDSTDTPYDKIDLTHELLENRPTGPRLLRYDPRTHRTDVLLNGLSLANGVALAPDQSYVLVAESYRYRITRYWLTGPKAGTHDIFASNLPGFPDNITAGPGGTFWVALYQPRSGMIDFLQRHPFLKAQLAKLPDALLTAGQAKASHGPAAQPRRRADPRAQRQHRPHLRADHRTSPRRLPLPGHRPQRQQRRHALPPEKSGMIY